MRSGYLCALTLLAAPLAAQQVPPPPVPAGNPITPAKTRLGKALFWDEQLSATRTVSCGTCHIPSAGGVDPRAVPGSLASRNPGPDGVFGTPDDVVGSPGVIRNLADGRYQSDPSFGLRPQVTGRKSISMIMAAYPTDLFWDGRASETLVDPVSGAVVLPTGAGLESQVLAPPVSPVEMGHAGRNWPDVETRIAASDPLALAAAVPADLAGWIAGRGYPELFLEAFGTPEVTAVRVAMAIATYERTLISDQTPFDAFRGGNMNALTFQERRGLMVFNGPGRCATCHTLPLFEDDAFHYIGVRPQQEDPGRGAVTGLPQDEGRMRTPGLRNVALRAPYFHDGSAATLAEVVAFYNRGGDFNGPNKAPQIVPLGLSPQQQADLVAFLGRPLTDPRVTAEAAPFDRPQLYAESSRRPVTFGAGSPGAGGIVPRMIAVEPPLVGNPNLTLGLDGAGGGSFAFLGLDAAASSSGFQALGITIHLGLTPALQVLAVGPVLGLGPGNGWTSMPLTVPNDPNLAGQETFAQWFLADPAAPGGWAASEAVRLTWF